MSSEQYEDLGPVGSWLSILLFTLFLMTWMMFLHMCIRDVPRQWDFGQRAIAPAEAVTSTAEPPYANRRPPRQIQTLPEAVPPPGGVRP